MSVKTEIYRPIQYSNQLVPESKIAAFCAGCDKLNPNNGCVSLGPSRQAKYVIGGSCRWAFENGVHGTKTQQGFFPDPDS